VLPKSPLRLPERYDRAALEGRSARVVDQDLAHRAGGHRVEVLAAVPVHLVYTVAVPGPKRKSWFHGFLSPFPVSPFPDLRAE
jgi:hypothetical protein